MSHLDRLLQDDLNRLVDRIAARAGDQASEYVAVAVRRDIVIHRLDARDKKGGGS